MKKPLAALVLVLALASPCLAGSAAGVAKHGAGHVYGFHVAKAGTIFVEIQWEQPHADGFAVLVCSVGDLESVVLGLPRDVRGPIKMATGALKGSACAVGVNTFEKPVRYTVTVSLSGQAGPDIARKKSDDAEVLAVFERIGDEIRSNR